MAWYDEAIFYHIYPLGMTGAPKQNAYGEPVERLNKLLPWISHIKEIGCNAIYIGPLFESVGHGYETTDYKKLDNRLGTNETLKKFVSRCHAQGIRVIFDGVFNHTGRDFFAFKDLKENRENSKYKDWYCNVNFWGNNSYNDGFSYDNWGGYDLLVKLNQRNPEVKNYICDVIRYWVEEFDVDGIRLDAADVLDFEFMKDLRRVANEVKPEFWLMGEVIHGDYIRWANADTLHSVTNYHLHKALYSGYNDHNFFEIAHTVKRLNDMGGGILKLYNFVDNHDVERIMSKLSTPNGFLPVHILLYTLPGVPSIYYGSEFGIEGRKGRGAEADAPLRPELDYEDWLEQMEENTYMKLISKLGKMRQQVKALSYGDYREMNLTTRQYTFTRNYEGSSVVVMVNNDDNPCTMYANVADGTYTGVLSEKKITVSGGNLSAEISGNSGEVWIPDSIALVFDVLEESAAETEMEEAAKALQNEGKDAVIGTEDNKTVAKDVEIKTADNVAITEDAETVAVNKVVAEDAETVAVNKAVAEDVETVAVNKAVAEDAETKTSENKVTAEDAETEALENKMTTEDAETEASENKVTENTETETADHAVTERNTETAESNVTVKNSEAEVVNKAVETNETDNKTTAKIPEAETVEEKPVKVLDLNKPYEKMTIEELQESILAKMRKNGPVTDEMKRTVDVNTHRGSLLNWVRSFN